MVISFLLRLIDFPKEILTLRGFRNCSTFRQHATWKQNKTTTKMRFSLTRKIIDKYVLRKPWKHETQENYSVVSALCKCTNICIFPFPALYIKRPQVVLKDKCSLFWDSVTICVFCSFTSCVKYGEWGIVGPSHWGKTKCFQKSDSWQS